MAASVLTARITNVESPFPFADSAHHGAFEVTNRAGQLAELRGYVARFVAVVNGQEVELQRDDSAEHSSIFKHVADNTFLFFTRKQGICMDQVNLTGFPLSLWPGESQTIGFYLIDIDLADTLSTHGIVDAATAQNQACQFRMEVHLNLATGEEVASVPIEVV